MKTIKYTAILILALTMMTAMNVPAFADDGYAVLDLGVLHNIYIGTDDWIKDNWEHEVIESGGEEYILLKRYTGTDPDPVIYGKATAGGKTCPVVVGLEYDSGTGKYRSFISGNTYVKSVKFVSVNGTPVMPQIAGKANGMFSGMTALEKVEFNDSFGGALEDISGMFEGCTALKTADLTGLDLSGCKKAERTFKGCTSATVARLTGTDLKKLTDASEMYAGCTHITSIDLTQASWGNVLSDTAGMFSGDDLLGEITVPASFTAGTTSTDMFKTTAVRRLLIKGNPSATFINRVCPTLESSNRYIGEVKVTAAVSLTGDTLAADMFTCKLYKDTVTAGNLLKTTRNDSSGKLDFGTFRVSDISKPLKFIAVQEEVPNVRNETGDLMSQTRVTLKADGSLQISE